MDQVIIVNLAFDVFGVLDVMYNLLAKLVELIDELCTARLYRPSVGKLLRFSIPPIPRTGISRVFSCGGNYNFKHHQLDAAQPHLAN